MVILTNKLVMTYLLKKLKNNSTFSQGVLNKCKPTIGLHFLIYHLYPQWLVDAGHEPTVPARSALHFFDTKKCKVNCKVNAQNCKVSVKDLSNETPGRVVITYSSHFVKHFYKTFFNLFFKKVLQLFFRCAIMVL